MSPANSHFPDTLHRMDEASTNPVYLAHSTPAYVGVPCGTEHLLLVGDDPSLEKTCVAQQNLSESLISEARSRFVPLHRRFENEQDEAAVEESEAVECLDVWTKLLQTILSPRIQSAVISMLVLLIAMTSLAEIPAIQVAILGASVGLIARCIATLSTWRKAAFGTLIVINVLGVYNAMFLSYQEQREDLAKLADNAAALLIAAMFCGVCLAADSPTWATLKLKLYTISIVMILFILGDAISYFRHRDVEIITTMLLYVQLPLLVSFCITLTSERIADVYALNLQTGRSE